MILMRLIGGVRSHFITRGAEWILAWGMVVEGAQLVRTGDTFKSTHAYAVMASMVSEGPWGFLGIAIGAAWLVALLLNGTFISFGRISPWVRSLAAFVSAFYWGVYTIAMAFSNPIGTGTIDHAILATLTAFYSIIIAREVGAADKRAKIWRRRNLQTHG